MRKETQEEVIHHGRMVCGQFIRPEGNGPYPVVIFSHGFNGSYTNFLKDAYFMAEQGSASFCFDFCGGSVEATSSMDTTEMTITTECEDLRAVVDWCYCFQHFVWQMIGRNVIRGSKTFQRLWTYGG